MDFVTQRIRDQLGFESTLAAADHLARHGFPFLSAAAAAPQQVHHPLVFAQQNHSYCDTLDTNFHQQDFLQSLGHSSNLTPGRGHQQTGEQPTATLYHPPQLQQEDSEDVDLLRHLATPALQYHHIFPARNEREKVELENGQGRVNVEEQSQAADDIHNSFNGDPNTSNHVPPSLPQTVSDFKSKRLRKSREKKSSGDDVECAEKFDTTTTNSSSSSVDSQFSHTPQIHNCFLCNKTFTKKCHLDQHLESHTKERPYTCSTCDKTFIQKAHLSQHMLTHTNERNHFCSYCNKTFTQKTHLNAHLLVHTKDKPFQCHFCDRRFTQKSHLKGHLLTHSRQRQFPCPHCSKAFIQKPHLKQHLLTHSQTRRFQCPVAACDKAFIQKTHLNNHMLTHTKQKPHRCGECGKSFAQKSHLTGHERVHRQDRCHKCYLCSKAFIQSTHLTNHLKNVHGLMRRINGDEVDLLAVTPLPSSPSVTGTTGKGTKPSSSNNNKQNTSSSSHKRKPKIIYHHHHLATGVGAGGGEGSAGGYLVAPHSNNNTDNIAVKVEAAAESANNIGDVTFSYHSEQEQRQLDTSHHHQQQAMEQPQQQQQSQHFSAYFMQQLLSGGGGSGEEETSCDEPPPQDAAINMSVISSSGGQSSVNFANFTAAAQTQHSNLLPQNHGGQENGEHHLPAQNTLYNTSSGSTYYQLLYCGGGPNTTF